MIKWQEAITTSIKAAGRGLTLSELQYEINADDVAVWKAVDAGKKAGWLVRVGEAGQKWHDGAGRGYRYDLSEKYP